MKNTVSIIIVSHNNFNDTIACINSILLSNYINYRITVVDISTNVSQENELNKLIIDERITDKDFFIWLKRENKGYAFAANEGIKSSSNNQEISYYWILNNDTIILSNTLEQLLKKAESEVEVGIIGSKILYHHDHSIINSVGGKFNPYTAWMYNIGLQEKDMSQYDNNNFKFNYVYGASLFVTKKFVETVGLMNENYFLYYEELDWAIRGLRNNFKISYCYPSVIYHKQGAATGNKARTKNENLFFKALQYENLIKFYKLHYIKLIHVAYFKLMMTIFKRIIQLRFKEAILIFKIILGRRVTIIEKKQLSLQH
jgi:GT2 family glycosyltransferase